jgi:hypothetical protein
MKPKKELTPMEKLTANHNELMKGKTIIKNNKALFESTLKKAIKPKQRGSK